MVGGSTVELDLLIWRWSPTSQFIVPDLMTLQTTWAVLFGGLQRDGFLDCKGTAKWLLSLVSEGKGVDGWGSGTMGFNVRWREVGGGAGSDWLTGGSNGHGSLGSL
jgi:hypothetical protein